MLERGVSGCVAPAGAGPGTLSGARRGSGPSSVARIFFRSSHSNPPGSAFLAPPTIRHARHEDHRDQAGDSIEERFSAPSTLTVSPGYGVRGKYEKFPPRGFPGCFLARPAPGQASSSRPAASSTVSTQATTAPIGRP